MLKELIYFIKRPYHFVKTGLLNGLPAQFKYRFPARKLKIIAFTGTDGKTTSSTMMYHVLKNAGKKVGLLSTVAAYVGDKEFDTGFHVTSPSPSNLQKFMRMMVNEGYEYLVLEATSHGIYQYRIWGITPWIAGLTNIANEHLDYHLTYDHYVEAKSLLLKKAHIAVINADDQSHQKTKRLIRDRQPNLLEYSLTDPLPKVITQAINKRFKEPYNHSNARLVTTVGLQLNLTAEQIASGIASFPGVPGRMQFISNKRGFEIVVDFAHTPQAVAAVLQSLRKHLSGSKKGGRLIAILGCAGLRDHHKRPEMGRLAAELADIAIFTAEDPRTEEVWSIIRQMKSNLGSAHNRVMTIPDRYTALNFTLNTLAKKGDVIAVLGKGHEQSMCFGTVEYPWNDAKVVQELLVK